MNWITSWNNDQNVPVYVMWCWRLFIKWLSFIQMTGFTFRAEILVWFIWQLRYVSLYDVQSCHLVAPHESIQTEVSLGCEARNCLEIADKDGIKCKLGNISHLLVLNFICLPHFVLWQSDRMAHEHAKSKLTYIDLSSCRFHCTLLAFQWQPTQRFTIIMSI